jgi:molybdopterin molybdotransferase
MLDVTQALTEIRARVRPLEPTVTPLSPDVLGRVLATDVLADTDSPPFAKSLRDGYAVRAADCVPPQAVLAVVAEIAAGAVPTQPIHPGECVRIFTGAPLPEGADAVVMQENTQPLDGERVQITDPTVRPGQWVFPRGAEMRAGEVVLPAGTVITPVTLGVLASIGMTRVSLYDEPRVSIIATGNELVEAGGKLQPGQIYNSNGPLLTALATQAGGRVENLGIAPDNPADIRLLIEEEFDFADVLLLAGGVSVGKFDLVPGILEELGVAIHFRQVRMKPGKPLLFGTKDQTLVFGLPGNPVSVFVCFELFVRPTLRVLAGHTEPGPRTLMLPLAQALAETNDRPTYHPAKLEMGERGYSVRPLPWRGAPDLRGLQPADALLVLPPGEIRWDCGQLVQVVLV